MTDKRKTCLICGSDDNKSVYPKESLITVVMHADTSGTASDYRDQGEFYLKMSHTFTFHLSHNDIFVKVRQRIDMVKRYLKTGLLLARTGEVILAAEEEGFDVVAAENPKFLLTTCGQRQK